MNLKQQAKEYFNSHPAVGTFHLTSDGLAFVKRPDAEYHSKSLKENKVSTYERATIDNEPETDQKDDTGENNDTQTEHTVTSEDLAANKDLGDLGVKEGDKIGIPTEKKETVPPKAAPKKAAPKKS